MGADDCVEAHIIKCGTDAGENFSVESEFKGASFCKGPADFWIFVAERVRHCIGALVFAQRAIVKAVAVTIEFSKIVLFLIRNSIAFSFNDFNGVGMTKDLSGTD